MKKRYSLLFVMFLLAINVFGQSLKQFNDLVDKNDTIGQIKLLEHWEQLNNNDPDLYVAYFNYYFLKSRKEVVVMGKEPKGANSLQMLDTLTKKPVGYMYSETILQPNIISKGLEYIDKGINKFPNRLDMRFGKVYVFGEMADFENFTKEIIYAIDYSNVIDNKWLWADNKPLDDPKNYMLKTIQSYQNQLYNTGDDSLLNNMAMISKAVLKYYPDHVESLSNLSVVYLIQSKYDEALELLLRAEKIDPKDYIVLGNIAQAYKRKRDFPNSIKYFELMFKYGDDQTKQYAREQIQQLDSLKSK